MKLDYINVDRRIYLKGRTMEEKTKIDFVDLLNSDEVKVFFDNLFESQTDSIRQVVLDTQNGELMQESLRLKGELEKKKNEIKDLGELVKSLDAELKEKNKEIDSLGQKNSKLEKENKKLEEKNEKFEKIIKPDYIRVEERCKCLELKYALMEKVIDSYSHLSLETISRTKNIMGNGEIYDFISLSREWKNVEGLWNFIKRKIIEEDTVDIEALISIFECLFDFNQGCTGEVSLELIKTNIGTKYDSDEHSIIGIKTDGTIKEVLLPGIRETTSGKIIKKTLVKV